MRYTGVRALVVSLGLAALCVSGAAAQTIVLPERGSLPVAGRMEVAAGAPAAGDVLDGSARFEPYGARDHRGWPVEEWLRLRLRGDLQHRWVLTLPTTEFAELYVPSGAGYQRQVTGTDVAVRDRSLPAAVPSFLLDEASLLGKPLYLHVVYHPDLPFAPRLHDGVTYFDRNAQERLMIGIFLGCLLTLAALGAYVFAALRYAATGLFTLYLLAIVLNEVVAGGIGGEYLWPGLALDARLCTGIANFAAFLAFLAFARSLLRTRKKVPWLDAVLVGTFVVQTVLMAMQYAAPFGAAVVAPLILVELAGSALILAIALVRWRQGSRVAPWFVAAFVPVSVGTLANIAYDVFLPSGGAWGVAAYGVELGTIAECVMMSAIVLNRINLIHRERQSARRELTEHERENVELRRITLTDPLTGVANRARFEEELAGAIAVAESEAETLGVLYLDLDGFKATNDRAGHKAGDDVLRSAAHRLIAVARERDVVARLGGDEFAVLLRALPSASTLDSVVQRVNDALSIAGIAASVGAALYPRDGTNAEQLLDAADRSMYRDKERRKRVAEAGHAALH